MKALLLGLVLGINCAALACPGEQTYQRLNPDGSLGGLVSTSATVLGDVHVESGASICGKAWVEGPVRLSKRAQVYGSAYVRGTNDHPTLLDGSVSVYGSVRLMQGVKATGNVKIHGGGTLYNSELVDGAEFCLSILAKNLYINDNVLCDQSLASTSLETIGYQLDKFNEIDRDLIIKIKSDLPLGRESKIRVVLNGEALSEDFLIKGRGHVRLKNEALVDGINKLQIFGEYRHGVGYGSEEITLYASRNEHTIEMDFGHSDISSRGARVFYHYNEETFEGEVSFSNNSLTLKGFPVISEVSADLYVATNKSFTHKQYESLADIPLAISSLLLPQPSKISSRFSEDLSDIYMSHPDRVSYISKGGIKITSHPTDEVIVAKMVKVPQHEPGFSFPLKWSGSNSCYEAQLLTMSLVGNKLRINNRRSKSILSSDAASLRFKDNKDASHFLALKIIPSESSNCAGDRALQNEEEEVEVTNGISQNELLELRLMNWSARNRKKVTSSSINTLFASNYIDTCPVVTVTDEVLNENIEIHRPPLDLTHLSLNTVQTNNPLDPVNRIQRNRMWGTLTLPADWRSKGNPTDFYFNILQGSSAINAAPLVASRCARNELSSMFTNGSNNILDFNMSIFKPILEFNFSSLAPTALGADATAAIRAHITFPNGESYQSQPLTFPILVPFIVQNNLYNVGSIESYSNAGSGIDRTGGDKWIHPAYQNVLSQILVGKTFSQTGWYYNDFTFINGGNFGHSSHRTGTDADVSFGYQLRKHRLFKVGNQTITRDIDHESVRAKWLVSMNSFHDFLVKLNPSHVKLVYTQIDSAAITNQDGIIVEPSYPDIYHKQMFQGRCLIPDTNQCNGCDRRIIDFVHNPAISLLQSYRGHSDHLHVAMRPYINGEIEESGRRSIWLADFLKDLVFHLERNAQTNQFTMSVSVSSTATQADYIGIDLYWRIQDKPQFNNLDAVMNHGSSRAVARNSSNYTEGILIDPRLLRAENLLYLNVSLGDRNNGSCTSHNYIENQNGNINVVEFLTVDVGDLAHYEKLGIKSFKLSREKASGSYSFVPSDEE